MFFFVFFTRNCFQHVFFFFFFIFSSWEGVVEVSKPKTQISLGFGEEGGHYPPKPENR